jgi:beta-phosphoglucomutase-like phosphatase (HAD superfamily)
MKPDPHRVRAVVDVLDADNTECALIGDGTADVLAGLLAGVTVIGYANRPDKAEILTGVQPLLSPTTSRTSRQRSAVTRRDYTMAAGATYLIIDCVS